MNDPLDQMMDAADAPAWVAKQPGDYLKGTVVTTGSRSNDFGGEVPTVTVRVEAGTEDGQPVTTGELRCITGFQSVLARNLTHQLDRGMGYGWRCMAKYKGKRQGSHQEYADWGFVAEPSGAPAAPRQQAQPDNGQNPLLQAARYAPVPYEDEEPF